MALTATVTKKSVSYVQDKLHNITFSFKLNDSTKTPTEVINKDFSCTYQPGESPSQKVAGIVSQIQLDIDHYKAEQVIFNAAALDTAVTNIQSGLSL